MKIKSKELKKVIKAHNIKIIILVRGQKATLKMISGERIHS
jgi:hypothetical protein